MENTAWPDNKMGGKRSTKVQTNGANPVLFFKDVWERLLHIWARGKKWHWGTRSGTSKPELVTDVKETRFKWILMSGTITSGKCCLQLSFTNIHLTFGSVASETESPAGISAPAAAIFGCHFCPRSPSVCFCLLSRFLLPAPLLFFYMWNMWKEISCLQYLWIWELCYMSGGIFCNTYSNINTTNRVFIIYRKCLRTAQQYLP